MPDTREIRQRLERRDAHFRALSEKHRGYEARLEALRGQRYLSDEEKLEEVRLKKLKLALKDEMERMIREQTVG